MNLNPLFVSFLFFHLATLWCIYNTLRSIGLIPQILNCNMHHTCHLFLQMILTHLKVISIKSIRSSFVLIWPLYWFTKWIQLFEGYINSTQLNSIVASHQSNLDRSWLSIFLPSYKKKLEWKEQNTHKHGGQLTKYHHGRLEWCHTITIFHFGFSILALDRLPFCFTFFIFIYLVTLSTYYGL